VAPVELVCYSDCVCGLNRSLPACMQSSGRGSAWLERLVRDQEVGGSNPLAPTTLDFFALHLTYA
jgi:hypothetical protein